MTLELDHVVIAVTDLQEAIRDYTALGFTVLPGGVHANQATENALIVFADGTYLELLAATGKEPLPEMIDFSPMLANGPGLVGYALRTDDLAGEVERLRADGFNLGPIVEGSRTTNEHTLRWQLVLLNGEFAPFLIQDLTPREWRVPLDAKYVTHANRTVGLRGVSVVVRYEDIEQVVTKYRSLIGIIKEFHPNFEYVIGPIIVTYVQMYYLQKIKAFGTGSLLDIQRYTFKEFEFDLPRTLIEQLDLSLEPSEFAQHVEWNEETFVEYQSKADLAQTQLQILGEQQEVLFSVQLQRESADTSAFEVVQHLHVRFEHFLGVPTERGRDILVGLDDVKWTALNQAYADWGSRVPTLLRFLASDCFEVRDYAHERLISNLVHQGTIYEASIEAIPFLVQLLNAPHVDNIAPLNLLEYIVGGGFFFSKFTEQTIVHLSEAFDSFVKHFTHPDPHVRASIASLLSRCTHYRHTVEPLLKQALYHDPNLQVRRSCLNAIVRLWKTADMPEGIQKHPLALEQEAELGTLASNSSQPLALRFDSISFLMKQNSKQWVTLAMNIVHEIMLLDESAWQELEAQIGHLIWHVYHLFMPNYPDHTLAFLKTQIEHLDPKVRVNIIYRLATLVEDGVFVTQVLPFITTYPSDPHPDVRYSAVGSFRSEPFKKYVPKDLFMEIAERDPSLLIRQRAQEILLEQE